MENILFMLGSLLKEGKNILGWEHLASDYLGETICTYLEKNMHSKLLYAWLGIVYLQEGSSVPWC